MSLSLSTAAGQTEPSKSQEISDDGVPVLIKHLPAWEQVRDTAVLAASREDLERVAGKKQVLDLVELKPGTEAVAAAYPQGKLVIVEYSTPQASVEADERFRQTLEQSPSQPPVYYRRIGNYSAFVFDATDEAAAASLLDQIKYEKTVRWLGEDPSALKKLEQYFLLTTRDVFISTVLFIVLGLFGSVLAGIGTGFLYFRYRESKRAHQTRFSDAGGLTRLNLDDLSEPFPNTKA